jgi:hypothetical protein
MRSSEVERLARLRRSLAGVRRKAVWGSGVRLAIAMLVAAATASCGDVVREGSGSSYLIIATLDAASGAEPEEFAGVLFSDVLTVVEEVPTIFSDSGRVTFQLGMKDPGLATSPSQANFITVDRYQVRYIRADGRNTPGVDVPYGFDGAFTLTVGEANASAAFTLVRHIAKAEAPLAALQVNGVIISTIAEITFFGHDQTGREVSAVGHITVHFGNFGDPD